MRAGGPWAEAIRQGLVWGGVAVFLAMVGMVDTFAERQIVAGVISLGLLLLVLTALGMGYQVARRTGGRAAVVLLRGALAGALAGALVAALVWVASVVNLRAMFVSATPRLFALLSFGRGPAGTHLILLGWALGGLVGAAAALLGKAVRGPLFAGLAWVLVVGLFQEVVQLVLARTRPGSVIQVLLFSAEGLLPRGALIIFMLAAGGSALWRWRRPATLRWREALPPSRQRALRALSLTLVVLLVLLVPVAAGPFLSQVLVLVGIFALLGLGLNVVVGFAGLLDLGYVAFFAIGAYTMGLLISTGQHGIAGMSFWAAIPVTMVASLIAGVILGIPVLRIRGDYLAIVTLGFGEIIRLLVLSDALRPWLGGSQGVLSIPKPAIGGFEFRGPEQLFYIVVAGCLLVIFVSTRLRDSRLGRAWMAVREDEDVAEAMGINLVNVKLLAFAIGAAFGGLSGAIFAVMIGSVFPHSFNLLISINVLALIIVGGMGSIPGVVVGSLFLVGLPELFREFAEYRFLVYGAALVVMMQLRPEGLLPAAIVRRELHVAEEPVAPPLPAEPAEVRPASDG